MRKTYISASLMCADQLRLYDEISSLVCSGADMIHIDVMDGQFVPNIQLGTEVVKAVKREFGIPLDIHLMITSPHQKLGYFPVGEGDLVSIHYQTTPHPARVCSAIRSLGAKALLALDPETPLCVCEDIKDMIDGLLIMTVDPGYAGQKLIPGTLKKAARAREMMPDKLIEADGNVSFENAALLREAGADILVCGSSSLFSGKYTYDEAIKKLKGGYMT